jgi:hypothetical protein
VRPAARRSEPEIMMGRKKRRRAGGFGSEVFVCLFVCL